jgi:hypothetical protein
MAGSILHGSQIICVYMLNIIEINVLGMLTLIVTPEAALIIDNRFIRFDVGRHVSMPKIAMDERGLDGPTISLHGP